MQRKKSPPEEENAVQMEKLFSAFIDRYRYSALGSLIKGVVHNLNGSMQILSMHMELLQRMVAKEEGKINAEIPAKIGQCMEQMDRFREMVEVLIQKGVQDDQDNPQAIHLNEVLEEELSVLKHNLFFKHQVQVQKKLLPSLPPLKGYYVDFSQGLLNLIQNALEAMEDTERKELTVTAERKDHQIQVTIQDTGSGVPEEMKPHLFKPFHTTKGGRHPGLGLYISQRLLAPYGASFDYSSKPGETIFEVKFPL